MIVVQTVMNAGLVLCALASFLAQQAPVPSLEDQKEPEKLIREIFKEEYRKKSAADRSALARKLLEQAQDIGTDAVSRYVLLREAKDLAVQAGNAATALQAVDMLSGAYAVDALDLKLDTYAAIGKAVQASPDLSALAVANLGLAEEASEKDRYDVAKSAADAAAILARRLKDVALFTRAQAMAKEAGERREKHAKIKKAQETLSDSPDDPEANLAVGRFECWTKGDWERGLRRLAKGSDPALKALAEEDLGAPTDLAAQIKLGDAWWTLSEKAETSHKSGIQDRARHWYRLAIPSAEGLTRAKLEIRLKGTWIPLFDGRTLSCIKESSRPAWEAVDGALCKRSDTNAALQSRQLFQDGDIRIRFEIQGLKQMTVSVRQGVKGKDALLFAQPQIAQLEGKVHEILFQCEGPEVKAFLDGQPAVLFSRAPAVEGHIQIWGQGSVLKILSLEYRQAK